MKREFIILTKDIYMGQSLVQNYIHIVFSVKNRNPLIDEEIEKELFKYIGGICNNLNCQCIKVGGYKDHIHILCKLSKNISLSKLIQEIKANSSKWIKRQGSKYKSFYWQNGYGVFSVSSKQLDVVISYIENQKRHHSSTTFQKEFIHFLNNYDIDYNEKYIWD